MEGSEKQYKIDRIILPLVRNEKYLTQYPDAKISCSKPGWITYEIYPNHFATFYFYLENGKRVDWAGNFSFKDVLRNKWGLGEFYKIIDGEKIFLS